MRVGVVGVPLLETKFHAPRDAGAVSSLAPASSTGCDPRRLPPLTLVSAPAGFGKTTLLSEWLATAGRRRQRSGVGVARRSRQRPTPASGPTSSPRVRVVAPDIGETALSALLQTAQSSMDGVVATLLNDLGTPSTNELVSCWTTTTSSSRRRCTSRWRSCSSTSPRTSTSCSASRADPPCRSARLRARGELLEVRAADLRFTVRRGRRVLQRGDGPRADRRPTSRRWRPAPRDGSPPCSSPPCRCRAVTTSPGSSPASPVTTASSSTTSSTRCSTARPAEVRGFLLRHVDPEPAHRVAVRCRHRNVTTGRRCSRRSTGRTCSSSRSTTVGSGTATTTCSPTSCRARLLDEDPDLVAELHRRASDWYERNGDRAEAIRHAMAAEDFARAAELVELAVPAMRQTRQEATLARLARRTSAPSCLREPARAEHRAGRRSHGHRDSRRRRGAARPTSSGWSTAVRLRRRSRWSSSTTASSLACRRRRPCTAPRWPCSPATSQERSPTPSRAHRSRRRGRSPRPGARQPLLGPRPLDARRSRARPSIATPSPSAASSRPSHSPTSSAAPRALADIQSAQGRLGAAIAHLRVGSRARPHPRVRCGEPPTCTSALSELLRERNDLDAARIHVQASAELGEHAGAPTERLPLACRPGPALAARRRRRRRTRAARRGRGAPTTPTSRRRSDRSRAVAARDAHSHTVISPRRAAGRRAGASPPTTSSATSASTSTSRWPGCCSPSTSTSPPAEPLHDAVALLDRLLAAAEDGQRSGSAIEILVLQALAHHAAGDTREALDASRSRR